MALDLRNLRPTELARLLNSTDLGPVMTERQVHRHRTRAGFKLGDGKTIDLLRYAAWVADERLAPATDNGGGYEARKEAARQRNAALARAGRDIAPLPEVVDTDRKTRCQGSFRQFCEAYFRDTFHLTWSPVHLRIIERIEHAVLHGGLFAVAAPRGTGKSVIAEIACLWAMLYGHRDFVCLIGSDEGHASAMLDSIKTELECNDRLADDFPEVAHPIRSLEGIANRCSGQLCDGNRTMIGWTANEIVLPTIPDSLASGAIVRVAGLTGRIRGMKYKRPDGRTVRPSLVILDDPQTDESARSLSQCANRERVIAGAVLGLAGPGKKISGIMPCTVIRPGDVADRVLDRELHPEWNGERTQMVERFPTAEKLWETYAQLRADCLRAHGTIAKATDFYRQHQAEMDAGAVVSWPERHNADEYSAIQHAMNLQLQDPAAFAAEYQNQPLAADDQTDDQLTVDDIAARVNGLRRRTLPIAAQHLTAFIDVQGKLLYWVVCAWAEDFTGWVIDYGTDPKQRSDYFSLRAAAPTLQDEAPGTGVEGAIRAGLDRLVTQLMGQPWRREDGAEMRVDRLLIDANWGLSTDVVYGYCQSTEHGGVIIPSHGRYVGASSLPFADYRRKRGDRIGFNWRIPSVAGKRAIRHVVYDTNFWKSAIHARLFTAIGDRGALTLFGNKPDRHRLLAEHCTAEYKVPTSGRGRSVDEWKLRPDASDNHWWDGLVGCAVGASMAGASVQTNRMPHAPSSRLRLSTLRKNH